MSSTKVKKVSKKAVVAETEVEVEAPVVKKSVKSKKVEEVEEVKEEVKEKTKKRKAVSDEVVDEEPVVVKKEKKEKKEKKVEEEVVAEAPKEEKKTKKTKAEKAEKAVEEEPAQVEAPKKDKKKRFKRENDPNAVERDPFEVLASDPEGMTEDLKRQVKVKATAFATRFVLGKEEPNFKDVNLDAIKIEFGKHGLDKTQFKTLNEELGRLKWIEVSRSLQIWANNPSRIPKNPVGPGAAFPADRALECKKKFEAIVKRKKNNINHLEMRSRAISYKRQAKESEESGISPQIVVANSVANRLAIAEEAAKARKQLSSM